MHAYEGISGTYVLTRTVPTSISQARSFECTRRAKHGLIARIACVHITTHDFHSISNRAVP